MSSEERKFLHDMATPLSIVSGMISIGTAALKKAKYDAKVIERFEKAAHHVKAMEVLLKSRRQTLIDREETKK